MDRINIEDFWNKQTQLIKDAVDSVNKHKETIIKQNLDRLGIDIDFEQESKRRFKRFAVEYDNIKETYYFDDGSIDGVKICEIYSPVIKSNPNGIIVDFNFI